MPKILVGKFKRIYVCLGALKEGFMAGCRRVLGFDGAFLKGPFPGQLLSAIGLDADNGMYHVAYAIVETENKDSWKWFLELVVDDLQVTNNWVFISDEQKGLVPAVQEVLPGIEHRWCLQHIFSNFRKEHRGQVLKECLFRTARATNKQHFQAKAKLFEQTDVKAYRWAIGKDPRHWCKAFWTTAVKSDISMNNICESFNGFILPARSRAVISMLETIRSLLMKRIQRKQAAIKKQNGPLCKRVQAEFEKIKKQAMGGFITTWNGKDWYQVKGPWDKFMVSLTSKTCTCGRWDLTGIPCMHAISAIYYSGNNGGNGVAEAWVHDSYSLKTQEKIYTPTINPINGVDMWEHYEYIPIVAPCSRPQPGRPKKLRRRDPNEPKVRGVHLSRRGRQMRCKRCGNEGHNLRGCKGFDGCEDNPMKKRRRKKNEQNVNAPVIGSSQNPSYGLHSQPDVSQSNQGSGSGNRRGFMSSSQPDVLVHSGSTQGRVSGRGRGYMSSSQPDVRVHSGSTQGRVSGKGRGFMSSSQPDVLVHSGSTQGRGIGRGSIISSQPNIVHSEPNQGRDIGRGRGKQSQAQAHLSIQLSTDTKKKGKTRAVETIYLDI